MGSISSDGGAFGCTEVIVLVLSVPLVSLAGLGVQLCKRVASQGVSWGHLSGLWGML